MSIFQVKETARITEVVYPEGGILTLGGYNRIQRKAFALLYPYVPARMRAAPQHTSSRLFA